MLFLSLTMFLLLLLGDWSEDGSSVSASDRELGCWSPQRYLSSPRHCCSAKVVSCSQTLVRHSISLSTQDCTKSRDWGWFGASSRLLLLLLLALPSLGARGVIDNREELLALWNRGGEAALGLDAINFLVLIGDAFALLLFFIGEANEAGPDTVGVPAVNQSLAPEGDLSIALGSSGRAFQAAVLGVAQSTGLLPPPRGVDGVLLDFNRVSIRF